MLIDAAKARRVSATAIVLETFIDIESTIGTRPTARALTKNRVTRSRANAVIGALFCVTVHENVFDGGEASASAHEKKPPKRSPPNPSFRGMSW